MRTSRTARLSLAVFLAIGLITPAAVADTGFPSRLPNDPEFGPGGSKPGQCTENDQFPLYSTIPTCYPHARDPENAAGMSVDAAWKKYGKQGIGDPNTVIAYIEGGINWKNIGWQRAHPGASRDDVRDLIQKVRLNTGELPLPEHADGSTCKSYDCDGDGLVSALDYAHDPRVKDYNGNGFIDPQDLIKAFSDGKDNDHNGYVDDIAGWNFVDDTNDPSTDEQDYTHGNEQARVAAAQTDNKILGAGICPRCQVLFVKDAAEALSQPDHEAAAFIYAVDQGASVITSETISLGYSRFQAQAIEYAWRKGVVIEADSHDFDSASHSDGMYWPHVLPGQSIVPQTASVGSPDTTSFREHSNITSRGLHSMFAVPTIGGSSSESDPTITGLVGLVASFGKARAARPNAPRGTPGGPLSAGELQQVLIATSSRITARTDPHLGWPAPDAGWSYYYGYGRPNALKAFDMIAAGRIPPVADITSPSWYQLVDPLTGPGKLRIDGTISAPRAREARYTVEYALGPEPRDNEWHTLPAAKKTVHGSYSGPLATLDLRSIPRDFATQKYRNTGYRKPGTKEAQDQYALTLRVKVTDDKGVTGVDRRAVYLRHDPAEQPGWPRKQVAGGESQPALADLDGDGKAEIVVGNTDGEVHAYRQNGTELPGWPVHTGRSTSVGGHRAPGYREIGLPDAPITAPVAVGDLTGSGRLDVVAQTTDGQVYAWDARGRPLKGFPAKVNRFAAQTSPTQQIRGRAARPGSTSAPVLADLDGNGRKEIVAASYDGRVYVIRPDGSDQPGWPVRVTPPPFLKVNGLIPFDDQRLTATPAVGDITGDGRPEIVIPGGGGLLGPRGGPGKRFVFALDAQGNKAKGGPYAKGWPALIDDPMGMGGGFDYAGESPPSVALAPLHGGKLDVITSSEWAAPTVLDGAGKKLTQFATPGNDPAVTFTTAGALARTAGKWSYYSPGIGMTSFQNAIFGSAGIARSLATYTRGFDPLTGAALPSFPRFQTGMSLLGEPAVADVDGDGVPEVLVGTDTMTLHAFRPGGGEAPGFPVFTGGWIMNAPAVGDLNGDGRVELAFTTREGYLHVITTQGRASANQWCHWQGNVANTGVATATCPLPHSTRH